MMQDSHSISSAYGTYYNVPVEGEVQQETLFSKFSKVAVGVLVGAAVVATTMTVYVGLQVGLACSRSGRYSDLSPNF